MLDKHKLILEQATADSLDIVGLTVWDGVSTGLATFLRVTIFVQSIVLSKYLEVLHQKEGFGNNHERVLELGSGCGLVAMAAAVLGAYCWCILQIFELLLIKFL